jgi:hypothetical protein
MMHVYRKTKEGTDWLYTVGYFLPDGAWVPLEDTSVEEEARALVNYLNGGLGNPFQYART